MSRIISLLLLLFLLPGARALAASPDDDLPAGRWRRSKTPPPGRTELTPEMKKAMERLESIGYVSGSMAPTNDPVISNYDPARSQGGYNLYCSGHEPSAILMDMQGNELHRWQHSLAEVWPGRPESEETEDPLSFWRRAKLLPDGSLLAVFEGVGIFKLDRDSNLIWAEDNRAHHDLQVLENGNILVLTRTARVIPDNHPTEPLLEDFLTTLDPDGHEIGRVSVVECLRDSRFDPFANGPLIGDALHTNTVFVLDGRFADRAPWMKAGNVLTSMRNLDMIAVIDPVARTVPIAWKGKFRSQHDPRIVDDGNLLFFDNHGGDLGRFRPTGGGRRTRFASRVIEVDPLTWRWEWVYGGPPGDPLISDKMSTVHRLPNGNTLITESDAGRALEVTREGTVVWEFNSPHRAGPDREYVATLMEMIRLPKDDGLEWLETASGQER